MRVAGITIPDNKRLEIGLTEVYGVGRAQAEKILEEAGVAHGTKPTDLSEEQERDIRTRIENMTIEGELRRTVTGNIKRLKDIQAMRGARHARSMKVRGQRTKTNNRVVPNGTSAMHKTRKTMTSGRRKVEKK